MDTWYSCSKCGSRLAKPEVEPDLKPCVVSYDTGQESVISILIYAVDEEHAREIAPILNITLNQRKTHLNIISAVKFK